MCQKAMGNAFALLAGVLRDRLAWTRGKPRIFASSSLAERGFCGDCGTPLTFGYKESLFTYVTVGSLDHPELAVPEKHYGIEAQLPWLVMDDDLAREATLDDPRLMTMVVHQFQPG
jgi:hypothetical protein